MEKEFTFRDPDSNRMRKMTARTQKLFFNFFHYKDLRGVGFAPQFGLVDGFSDDPKSLGSVHEVYEMFGKEKSVLGDLVVTKGGEVFIVCFVSCWMSGPWKSLGAALTELVGGFVLNFYQSGGLTKEAVPIGDRGQELALEERLNDLLNLRTQK